MGGWTREAVRQGRLAVCGKDQKSSFVFRYFLLFNYFLLMGYGECNDVGLESRVYDWPISGHGLWFD